MIQFIIPRLRMKNRRGTMSPCRDVSRPPLGGGVRVAPWGVSAGTRRSANTRKRERRARGFLFGASMPVQPRPAIDRVMKRIVRMPWSGCWIFMGAINEAGYGIVGKGGRGSGNDRAHRITYQHFVGQIPDGLFVCHHCDTPSCCNPDHLFLGTNDDNMRDCRAKGRAANPPRNPHVVGEVHPGAKLTADQVVEMRALREQGWTEAALAARYGVHPVSVHKIVHRQRWRHVA